MYWTLTRNISFVIIVNSLAVGCASQKRLSDFEMPLGEVDFIVNAWQEEVATETQMTNPMAAGGGALGVLIAGAIDHTKHKRAEEAIVPIRDLLVEYPHSQVFGEKVAMSSAFTRLAGNAEPKVMVAAPAAENDRSQSRNEMRISPTLLFTNDLRTLIVRLELFYVEKPTSRNGRPRLRMHQKYEFARPIVPLNRRMDREAAQSAWLKWSQEELIALIEEGMDTVIELWEYHMSNPTLPADGQRLNPLYTQARGIELHRDGDIIWLRSSDWLFAVHRNVFSD